MGVVQDLYKEGRVKPGTSLQAKRDALAFFERRLTKEITTPYVWLATPGTKACESGEWRGKRMVARRRKLLQLVNVLRRELQLPHIRYQVGWEFHNLYFGNEAMAKWMARTGCRLENATFLGVTAGRKGGEFAPMTQEVILQLLGPPTLPEIVR